MNWTIQNAEGEFYAGFQEGKPVWFRSRRKETRFDETTANLVLKQLTQLGFSGLEKKLYEGATA